MAGGVNSQWAAGRARVISALSTSLEIHFLPILWGKCRKSIFLFLYILIFAFSSSVLWLIHLRSPGAVFTQPRTVHALSFCAPEANTSSLTTEPRCMRKWKIYCSWLTADSEERCVSGVNYTLGDETEIFHDCNFNMWWSSLACYQEKATWQQNINRLNSFLY